LGASSTRFDINYQKNIQEIDNKMENHLSAQNKLDYLRKKFRSDIDQITHNLMNEVEINSGIRGMHTPGQNEA